MLVVMLLLVRMVVEMMVLLLLLLLVVLLIVVMLSGNSSGSCAKGQRVGQFGQIIGRICAAVRQDLLSFPFGASILVPSFHLRVAQAKSLRQVSAILYCEILLAIELALECFELEIGESCTCLAWLLVSVH